MYATVNTGQIKPEQVTAFTRLWVEAIEPGFNQIATLIDLYALVNANTHTVMIVGIYTDEAEALACQMRADYQQLFWQMAHLVLFETVAVSGYTVISQ